MKRAIVHILKNETVLFVATLLAVATCFVVPVSREYVEYIDFRVLALLFGLMLVVAGFRSLGVFDWLVERLTARVGNVRQLVLCLVLICFLLSMWITNDVALITFVPFAIMALDYADCRRYIPYTVILQTIAANLGSMCTPIGNPQNLYLYTASGMSMGEFGILLLPYSLISLALIMVLCFMVKGERVSLAGKKREADGAVDAAVDSALDATVDGDVDSTVDSAKGLGRKSAGAKNVVRILGYMVLFVVCMLTVARILDYRIMLGIVVAGALLLGPAMFKRVDYSLLITFVAFFIFVGNMKQIPAVNTFLQECMLSFPRLVPVLASQVISNVPAAVLLSGFTDRLDLLMIGTNLGGLGTLIASMASLISYKLYAKEEDSKIGKYIMLFTALNVAFLIILYLAWMIIG